MEIKLEGIVVIVGNYGSGKTEVSINLGINRKHAGVDVCMADLDLVNPYFRTREAKNLLLNLGIELILPPTQYLQSDLPILSPAISGMLQKPKQLTLLDCGGDDVGVTVIGSLANFFTGKNVHMLQVVNPFRPFTDTTEGFLKIRSEIERASKMLVTGIVGNPNLIDETKAEDIYNGYDFLEGLSKKSGLPLKFITTSVELLPKIDITSFKCPVLPMERHLVPPWKKN